MDDLILRIASSDDASELVNIYAPFVKDTAITFEYVVPTVDEFRTRIEKTLQAYPYLVAICNDEIVGYAYTGRYHPRKAFDWAAETSIYLKQNSQKLGIGKRLYEEIEFVLFWVTACASKMKNDKIVACTSSIYAKYCFDLNRVDMAEESYIRARKALYRNEKRILEKNKAADVNALLLVKAKADLMSNEIQEFDGTIEFAFIHKNFKLKEASCADYINARDIYGKSPDLRNRDRTIQLIDLAIYHNDRGFLSEVEAEIAGKLKKRSESTEHGSDEDVVREAKNWEILAHLHEGLKRRKAAEEEYVKALNIWRKLAGMDHDKFDPDVAAVRDDLSILHLRLKRWKTAEEECVEALSIWSKLADEKNGKYRFDEAMTLNRLARLHVKLKKWDRAGDEFTKSLSILRDLAEKAPGRYNDDLAAVLCGFGAFRLILNQFKSAKALYAEATKIRLTQMGWFSPEDESQFERSFNFNPVVNAGIVVAWVLMKLGWWRP